MKQDKKGFENLEEFEREIIDEVIEKNLNSISKKIGTPSNVKVYFKTYKKEGKNKKTSIHLELKLNNKTIEADEEGWNSVRATKKVFEKIITQIEHEFHISETHHAHRKKPKSLKKPKEFIELDEKIKKDKI